MRKPDFKDVYDMLLWIIVHNRQTAFQKVFLNLGLLHNLCELITKILIATDLLNMFQDTFFHLHLNAVRGGYCFCC